MCFPTRMVLIVENINKIDIGEREYKSEVVGKLETI